MPIVPSISAVIEVGHQILSVEALLILRWHWNILTKMLNPKFLVSGQKATKWKEFSARYILCCFYSSIHLSIHLMSADF